MIMRQILRWKYSHTTLGYKTNQPNFPWNIFNVLKKKIIKDKYMAKLFIFYLFSHLADLVSKKLFQNFKRLYLGQMWEMGAMELTTAGPDTPDDPHETGAARTAARPLLVQKNRFRNYQKLINFWLL